MGSTIDDLYQCLPVNIPCPDLSFTGQLIALSTPVCGLSALWMSYLVRYCLLKENYLHKAKHLPFRTTVCSLLSLKNCDEKMIKQWNSLHYCLLISSVPSFRMLDVLTIKLSTLPENSKNDHA